MAAPLYREVLRDSWRLALKHTSLIWFGLLASFIGSASVFGVLAKAYYKVRLDLAPDLVFFRSIPYALGEALADPGRAQALTIAVFIIAAIVAALALYFLVSAQGTLVLAAVRYEKEQTVRYGDAWDDARRKFWPLFAINVLKLLLLIGCFFAVNPLLRAVAFADLNVWSALGFVVLVLLFFCVVLFISFISLFAVLYVMVHDAPLPEALVRAVRLFGSHWLVSLEVALVLFVLDIIATFAIYVVLVILSIPAAVSLLVGVLFNLTGVAVLLTVVLFVALVVIALLIRALYTACAVSVWASLFLHIDKGRVTSRIMQWIGRA